MIFPSHVLPHLMPFDGQNPHSVVVMEKCSIHHLEGIATMIQEVGCLMYYLPPYSPDYNPFESAFTKVKLELQKNNTNTDILLLEAITPIIPENCIQWIHYINKLDMHYTDIVTTYTLSITTACKEVYEVMIKCYSSVWRILHL